MKKNIYILLLAVLTISCDSWLDVESNSLLTDDDIAQYPELVEAQFLSNYAELRKSIQCIGDGAMTYRQHHLDVFTDDAASNSPWENAVARNNTPGMVFGGIFSQSAGEVFKAVWPYKSINDINKFIDKYRDTESDAIKNTLGEAYFIRAFYYFELTKRYGGVPLVSNELVDDSAINKRATELDSWNYIADNLDSAIVNLPETQPIISENRDRANKYTAYALKSRAMLYAATIAKYGKVINNGLQGIPAENAHRFFKLAAEAAKYVLTGNKYTLTTNYENLFNGLAEDDNEIIFRFANQEKTGVQVFHDYWNLSFRIKKEGYTTFMTPTVDVVEQYETLDGEIKPLDYQSSYPNVADFFANRDKRLAATVICPGGSFLGETFQIYRKSVLMKKDGTTEEYAYETTADMLNGATVPGHDGIPYSGVDGVFLNNSGGGTTNYGFFLKKTLYGARRLENYLSHENDQDAVIIRLGEVVLNFAEAAIELAAEGDAQYLAAAQTYFDELRMKHGGLPSKTMDLEVVRHERRVELIYEGFRYWDLKRWRIGDKIHNTTKKALHPVLYIDETKEPVQTYYKLTLGETPDLATAVKWFEERDYYSPIPTNENQGIIQNEGWNN